MSANSATQVCRLTLAETCRGVAAHHVPRTRHSLASAPPSMALLPCGLWKTLVTHTSVVHCRLPIAAGLFGGETAGRPAETVLARAHPPCAPRRLRLGHFRWVLTSRHKPLHLRIGHLELDAPSQGLETQRVKSAAEGCLERVLSFGGDRIWRA
jgi:hypothetical protein